MDPIAEFYSRPSDEYRGGAFNVFAGSRRQRGGGIFGSLKNFFVPIAKTLGKNLLSHGIGLARDVAQDAMEGKSVKNSLMDRGKARALDFGKSAARQSVHALSNMIGKGSRRARRKRNRRLQRRRITRRRKSKPRLTSRKRRKRSKSTLKRKAKRRRIAANF